ncbi:MAG: ribose-phosphate pyrophosphokinase [Cyclobacteriaceae bacterium]
MEQLTKIFAGNNSEKFAKGLCKTFGCELGDVSIEKFSDGELSVHFNESVRGHHLFLVQSTNPNNDNLMELLLMIDAAKRASAAYVTAVIPYYGYARQDRKDKPRVAIGAKLVANLLTASGADRIMTADLHAGQIQGFFDIPLDHLHASSVFVPYIESLKLDNLIFASPDVGGVKRTRSYAKYFGADLVVCDKHRERANQVASMQLIGDVTGANVVLVDDLIDTGGTMSKAADLLLEKGALSVRAICTHPILSGKAYENIENSSLQELVVTNTIPLKKESTKIKALDIGPLFAHAITKLRTHESISSLFVIQ